MYKLILLAQTLLVGASLGQTLDYPPDVNPYEVHPYYHHSLPEGPYPSHLPYSVDAQARDPYHPEGIPPVDERFGFFEPPFPGGTYGVGFGGPPPPPEMPPPGLPDGYRHGPPPNGPIGPPPFGYPDPGFQTQTGFEGLLVPNTWYGLLPWGIEGVIIVIAGIIVFAIIVISIIGLLGWFCGVKTVLPVLKTSEDDTEVRSRFGDQWANSLVDLSANVIGAIEKLNDIMTEDSEGEEEELKKGVR